MACSDDIKKYCNTVTPDEGRLILCIEAHEDKISTQRDYALFEAARNLDRALDRIEQVADICWNDIEKYCSRWRADRAVSGDPAGIADAGLPNRNWQVPVGEMSDWHRLSRW